MCAPKTQLLDVAKITATYYFWVFGNGLHIYKHVQRENRCLRPFIRKPY
jgi:hypothetical protein